MNFSIGMDMVMNYPDCHVNLPELLRNGNCDLFDVYYDGGYYTRKSMVGMEGLY